MPFYRTYRIHVHNRPRGSSLFVVYHPTPLPAGTIVKRERDTTLRVITYQPLPHDNAMYENAGFERTFRAEVVSY